MDRVWGAASRLACGLPWVATGHARGMRPGAASELPIPTILSAVPLNRMGRCAHFASARAPILPVVGGFGVTTEDRCRIFRVLEVIWK
jgi:hypothetical protein